jgi:hypothetical protein
MRFLSLHPAEGRVSRSERPGTARPLLPLSAGEGRGEEALDSNVCVTKAMSANLGMDMAFTWTFKGTIAARARRDPRLREPLFTEAINAYLAGDTTGGEAILRDLVNATIGFEGLAAEVRKPSKSLRRMLAPRGNPSTDNFFTIVSALQKKDSSPTPPPARPPR